MYHVGIMALVFRSLLNALIASIRKETFLSPMEQMVCLGNIVFIRCGHMDAVDYRRAIINSDMCLHDEVPLIALPR